MTDPTRASAPQRPPSRTVPFACLLASLLVPSLVGMPAPGRAQDKAQPPPLPPARKVPGLNAEDPHPRACVDCHVVYPEMKADKRLSTVMKPWGDKVEPHILKRAQASAPKGVTLKGKHPPVAFKDIPAGCRRCHSERSKNAPALSRLMHALHLAGGDDNHFMALFQGECTRCHKLDGAGGFSVPSGPEK
ncbi:MAG: hypothetical protein HY900_02060 [Deltaproteobacteria bacterium]|nr:hypothetical protein [Deltaproteobacteria bacterium]